MEELDSRRERGCSGPYREIKLAWQVGTDSGGGPEWREYGACTGSLICFYSLRDTSAKLLFHQRLFKYVATERFALCHCQVAWKLGEIEKMGVLWVIKGSRQKLAQEKSISVTVKWSYHVFWTPQTDVFKERHFCYMGPSNQDTFEMYPFLGSNCK